MPVIIDFHTHVFPWQGPLARALDNPAITILRKKARTWLRPFSHTLHSTQTLMRIVPESTRRVLDEIAALTPLPTLFFEATPEDHKEMMSQAGVDKAVVIPVPPYCTTDMVLELCEKDTSLIPAATIPRSVREPGKVLQRFIRRGARLLKIHAPMDGFGVDSPRYSALLSIAAEHGLPVILHTGDFHSHLIYRNPKLGEASLFEPWFEEYSSIKFILAHMNFHSPDVALDLCEKHENLYVDTSWQPAEAIGEAVRRIGPDRILFASDWPFGGNNMLISRQRIRDAVSSEFISEQDAEKIFSLNAEKLLTVAEPISKRSSKARAKDSHAD